MADQQHAPAVLAHPASRAKRRKYTAVAWSVVPSAHTWLRVALDNMVIYRSLEANSCIFDSSDECRRRKHKCMPGRSAGGCQRCISKGLPACNYKAVRRESADVGQRERVDE